ncbi:MAG: hypothetical protein GXO29_04525 [Thermotogae bacterium]|nr:hypothetical protein [Thermotogota bacterium]
MRSLWNYPLRALTVKKITLAFVFLGVGLALYSLLTYAAYLLAGLDISRVWNLHHLFPVPVWAKSFPVYVAERGGKVLLESDWSKFSPLSRGIWILALLSLLWMYFTAGIGVSRLELESMRGQPFYPLSEAFKESLRKSGLFWTTALLLLGVALVVLVVHAIPSVWGRIPSLFYLSAILITLTFGLLVVLSLLVIYMLIGYAFVLIYGPAVAVAMEGDTFDLYYEGFSIFNEKLHRFVLYEVWIYALKVVAWAFFTFVLFRAVRLSILLLEFLLPRFKFLYYPAVFLFNPPQMPYPLAYVLAWILPSEIFVHRVAPKPTTTTYIFGVAFDVWILIFLIVSAAYWASLTWTGRLHTYGRILKEKDGIDIFAIKPKASLEEVRDGG